MQDLLDPTILPPFSALTPTRILDALDRALDERDAVVDALIQSPEVGFEKIWLPLERASTAIDALWSAVGHLGRVADSPELREARQKGQARLAQSNAKLGQNRDLFQTLIALETSPDFASLAVEDRVAVERSLRNFRMSGVALEEPERTRFAAIMVELSELTSAFENAVVDATDAWFEHVKDEARLLGISEADKAMLASMAKARGLDGWLVTLQMPSVNAIMTFALDRELRARVYAAYGTRASDQGPLAGRFDNSARIARILALRHEAAMLLGFADPVERSLATKMAPNADAVLAFLRDLAARVRPAAERELEELHAFARESLGMEVLEPWDIGFVANRMRETRYSLNEEEVRGYFPLPAVLDGWKELLARLFGIALRPRHDVETYHDDVRYFDVVDESGTVTGGLYLDLYSRPGKQGGAWISDARPRLQDGNSIQVPVAYLATNFSPPSEAAPSLLRHGEVVTLLHETGHALHHVMTKVNRPSIGGINGFEWDAIELPSQLLEDFAWDPNVLTGMSGHYCSGERLPSALFDKILQARRFQSGIRLVRQIEFALFDLLLHRKSATADPMAVLTSVQDEISVLRAPPWHRMPHAFTHIFSGGYAAGYYSYLWAEVLAADGFERFREAGMIDRPTGDAMRVEVLSRGATRPAAESFKAFRGREPDQSALLRRHGLEDRAT